MNKIYTIGVLTGLIISCSEQTSYQTNKNKPKSIKTEIAAAQTQLIAETHSPHHNQVQATSAVIKGHDISRRADDLPPPINRTQSETVRVDLYTDEQVADIMPEVSYQYWTYNDKVPAPFIRVREGDTVELHLRHGKETDEHHNEQKEQHSVQDHSVAGHSTHSIDLHAVIGPGGGAPLTQVKQGEEKSFTFKASRAGIYVYHCASPHIPTHIANGMYGLILVEPTNGLTKVNREFYLMQGELYTQDKFGTKGLQAFSKDKLLAEQPEYFVINGRVNALTGDYALKAKVGEKIRLFIGVGSHIPSNFHIIGAIFDNLYKDGAITSPPLKNVQTTQIAAGSAVMIELTIDVPGKYLLVDHSLTRSIDKGALAELIIE